MGISYVYSVKCDWPGCEEQTGGFDNEDQASPLPFGWASVSALYNLDDDECMEALVVICPYHRQALGEILMCDDLQVST